MADTPYMTGFEEEIVNVHFASGGWCYICSYQGLIGTDGPTIISDVSFPDFAGGTPGWSQLDAAFLQPWGHVFTAAEIAVKPFHLDAGLAMARFGVKRINPGRFGPEQDQLSYSTHAIDTYGYSDDTAVFFKAPAPKFRIKQTMSCAHVTGVPTTLVMPIKPQSNVKAGIKPPLGFPCPAFFGSPLMKCVDFNGGAPNGSATFEIDMNKGTVTIVSLTGTARS